MINTVSTDASVLSSMAPETGQLVEVRRRQWIVFTETWPISEVTTSWNISDSSTPRFAMRSARVHPGPRSCTTASAIRTTPRGKMGPLRGFHRKMDVAVLRAYGWRDINRGLDVRSAGHLPQNDCVRLTVSVSVRLELLKRFTKLNLERHVEKAVSPGSLKGGRIGGSLTAKARSLPSMPRGRAAKFHDQAAAPAKKAGRWRTRR